MSDWNLIYSTNASGTPVFGTVTALRTAVMSGADVKVIYNPSGGVWWSRQCLSVSSRGGFNSPLVSATHVEALDTQDGSSGLEFNTPIALEYHIYNSNGVRNLQKIGSGGGLLFSESKKMPMRWYVKDYTVPWWQFVNVVAKAIDLETQGARKRARRSKTASKLRRRRRA